MLPMPAKPGTPRLLGDFTRFAALSQPKIKRRVDLRGGETLDLHGQPQVISMHGRHRGPPPLQRPITAASAR